MTVNLGLFDPLAEGTWGQTHLGVGKDSDEKGPFRDFLQFSIAQTCILSLRSQLS